ncbi:MAG: beta-mannosidase [bacterium]|nr:beta-mannosidase [bacterium]
MTRPDVLQLEGAWQLVDTPLGTTTPDALPAPAARAWLPVPVPGAVHQALLAAGKITEPLTGMNSHACAWIEQRAWWFRRAFSVSAAQLCADRLELELHGLDAQATIFLNGRQIGTHSNAFRPFICEIKAELLPGENVLLVRLTTGLDAVSDAEVQSTNGVLPCTEANNGRPDRGDVRRSFVRKPQYVFGWDWCPRVGSVAMAGPAFLRCVHHACIREVQLNCQQITGSTAMLAATITLDWLDPYATTPAEVTITLTDAAGVRTTRRQSILLKSGLNFVSMPVQLDAARLWWPAGLGEQHLYAVDVAARIGVRRLIHPRFRFGVRTIALDTTATFAVVVNGRTMFCKGANWIPADAIYARVTPARYAALLDAARAAQFNMLRVWGGGWYEPAVFYEMCDARGLLVWHDFMFACAPYPDHAAWFTDEVAREADYQTRRLRNHACMALWCGNNENHTALKEWWHDRTRAGTHLYNYVLPQIIQRNCPEIPYWNSSPYGGALPNDEAAGDVHHWGPCMMNADMLKRITPEEYDGCQARFLSEFGYVGACGRRSTEEYLGGAPLDPASAVWQHHTNVFEKNTVAAGIRKHYADPEAIGIDEYLLYSGLCQGLMYAHALDSTRYRENCHGCLFWMFNDCWGEVGWTIIDYYLRRKIAYWFVRRAYAPLRLIVRAHGKNLRGVLANDTPAAVRVQLEYGYMALDGRVRDLRRATVTAPALARTECCDFARGAHDPQRGIWFVRCRNHAEVAPAIHRALDFRQLAAADPQLTLRIVARGRTQWRVQVGARQFAHAVHFVLPDGCLPSDNYFDLLPGATREITISTPRALTAQQIKVNVVMPRL